MPRSAGILGIVSVKQGAQCFAASPWFQKILMPHGKGKSLALRNQTFECSYCKRLSKYNAPLSKPRSR